MSTLLRSLLAAAAFVTLVPTAASAGPPRCIFVCGYEASCEEPCRDERGADTTCGDYGWCGFTLADVTPSAARDEASLSEESALVCGDEQQTAQSTVFAES
jgi:hypothetical protein